MRNLRRLFNSLDHADFSIANEESGNHGLRFKYHDEHYLDVTFKNEVYSISFGDFKSCVEDFDNLDDDTRENEYSDSLNHYLYKNLKYNKLEE